MTLKQLQKAIEQLQSARRDELPASEESQWKNSDEGKKKRNQPNGRRSTWDDTKGKQTQSQ